MSGGVNGVNVRDSAWCARWVQLLVPLVQHLRPDWDEPQIVWALSARDRGTSRPPHLAGIALLALAAGVFGQTDSPGRLGHGGPWWDLVRVSRPVAGDRERLPRVDPVVAAAAAERAGPLWRDELAKARAAIAAETAATTTGDS